VIQSIKTTFSTFRLLADDCRGVSSLEYGVLVTVIIALVAAGSATIGSAITTAFTTTAAAITHAF
jgi:Flp pilus assembly pilin Flp